MSLPNSFEDEPLINLNSTLEEGDSIFDFNLESEDEEKIENEAIKKDLNILSEANQIVDDTFLEFGLLNKDSIDVANKINEPPLPLRRRLSKAEEELKSRSETGHEVLHFRERLKSKVDSSENRIGLKRFLGPNQPLISFELSAIEEKSGESGNSSRSTIVGTSAENNMAGKSVDPPLENNQ
ncbi:unnamed protein product, partial [Brugia timori]|uniref:Uncharacterized protein n=1 Tax=Brugia timori TaxID=42155 RepID=A0A0R3QJ77_9BILA